MPLVYDELRRLAANYLRHERPGQTLQATALVHEAFLRLGQEKNQPWKNRTHFLAIAALSMRAAEALDISPATVKRHWTLARAWLRKELGQGSGNGDQGSGIREP
jgi:DNA-directed RNA polymerase specialized sigma24 family protein